MPSTQSSETAASTEVASDGSTAAAEASVQEDLAFSLDNLSLLVEDIKDGFTATMQQLGKIEGQDAELRSRLDTVEVATQQKMDALQTAVHHMREQFTGVVARVESLELHHRQLEGQLEQLDRAAQAEKMKLSSDGPAFDPRAACQTPMTPYSCATPLSPDSGRPGTCTPSCCHSNEFHSGELGNDQPTRSTLLNRSGSATTVATIASSPASVSTAVGQGRQLCHHRLQQQRQQQHRDSSSSCEAVAERSLHMSSALVDRFAHADSSGGEDCELDGSLAETPSDGLTDDNSRLQTGGGECQLNGDGGGGSGGGGGGGALARIATAQERSPHQDRRRRVCQEIVETERKYCFCLWTIIDLIAESLKSATFMTMKDLCLIFPKCLPRLYELHSTFLGLLEERLGAEGGGAEVQHHAKAARKKEAAAAAASSGETATFSGVVLDFLDANDGELLGLYRDYANDFGTAVQTIRKYQQHSGRFRKLLHSLQHHPSCGGLDLTAFLLTPVQRMPRYLLLVRQLAACTPEGHPDQASLDCVLARLHCLLDELNYSIQTALRQAAAGRAQQPPTPHQREQQQQQHQQQHRWQRSSSLPRPADASAAAAAALADPSSSPLLSGSSGRGVRDRHSDGRHFLVSSAAAARCRSVPPPPSQQQQRRPTLPRTESPMMGPPRSRLLSRQLRTADRCLSAGDILRASPVSPASSSSLACDERIHQRLMRRGTPPKPTLKESFRRMFQSRRKSSLAKLESLPTCSSTFEDENGDPCTDV